MFARVHLEQDILRKVLQTTLIGQSDSLNYCCALSVFLPDGCVGTRYSSHLWLLSVNNEKTFLKAGLWNFIIWHYKNQLSRAAVWIAAGERILFNKSVVRRGPCFFYVSIVEQAHSRQPRDPTRREMFARAAGDVHYNIHRSTAPSSNTPDMAQMSIKSRIYK